MSTPRTTREEKIAQCAQRILLAMAINRRFQWFSPAELQHCARHVQVHNDQDIWNLAVHQLLTAGAIAMGRLVVGGVELPMIRTAAENAAITAQAAAILAGYRKSAGSYGQVFSEKAHNPKLRLPSELATHETG